MDSDKPNLTQPTHQHKGFFKRFAIPKHRRLANQEIEDEIVLVTPPQHAQPRETDSCEVPNHQTSLSAGTPSRSSSTHHAQTIGVRKMSKLSDSNSASAATPPEKLDLQTMRTMDHGGTANDASQAPPLQNCMTAESSIGVNSSTVAQNVTPSQELPFRPDSLSPSRFRVASILENKSPKKTPADNPSPLAMPPPPPNLHSAPVQPSTSSFSSVSTLTSVPVSSQSSSRRIIKNGMHAVTNSDSGSENSSNDSSDESLPDLTNFVPNKRVRLSPPEHNANSGKDHAKGANPAGRVLRGPNARANRKSDLHFPPSPPRLKYKHNLAKLVAQSRTWTASEARIADFESTVSSADEVDEKLRNKAIKIDSTALAAAAGSDSDDRDRMLQALERTEALKQQERYSFFLDHRPQLKNSPFPVDFLPDEPWSKLYRTNRSRRSTCISGFAAELAAQFPLPMPVVRWMACQLLHETDDVLCEAYVEILRASCTHLTSVSPTLFTLGSFYKTRSIADHSNRDDPPAKLPRGLKYIMRVVQTGAPLFDNFQESAVPHTTSAAFLDFALVNLDDSIRVDLGLSLCISRCIEDMLDSLGEKEYLTLSSEVVSRLFSSEQLSPVLRCRLIACLPAGTRRSSEVRRRLALACFSTTANPNELNDQDRFRSTLQCLKSDPEFVISETTNYTLLFSLITVLDIAIAGGFEPPNELSESTQAKPISPYGTLTPPSDAESTHNKQIDALTLQLQVITSRIRNVGTSHLKRTEAKSAIELLIARLEGCVRTRPKPKKGIFERLSEKATGSGLFELQETDDVDVIPFELPTKAEKVSGEDIA